MNILLINPPSPKGFTANRDFMGGFGMLHFKGGTILPPYNLLLLSSFIQNMHKKEFIDCVALNMNTSKLMSKIKMFKPDISFINTSTPTIKDDCNIAVKIKREFGSKIVLVGPHAIQTYEEVFITTNADAILLNNIPNVVNNLIDLFNKNIDVNNFEGAYINYNSRIIGRNIILKNDDLENLPFPNWELAPIKKYFYLYKNEFPYATMHSSIGCIFKCKFCPYPLEAFNKYGEMSAQRIVSEMKYLKDNIGVKMVLFRDALFTANRQRIEKLCELIKQENINIKWRCETSIDKVDENLLKKMSKSGCVGINFGIESIEDEVALDMECVNKRKDLLNTIKIFEFCKKFGIETFAFFISGLPNDKKSTIQKNAEFAMMLEPDHLQFTFATPYPGTDLYKIAKNENLLIKNDWENFSSIAPVMSTRFITIDEVDKLNKWAYRKFFLRPKRIIKELMMPNRLIRRALTYLNWINK